MDWYLVLGILAGVFQLGGAVPYVWSMLYGTTRPNKVTQILWVLLPGIQTFAQWSAGPSWSLILMAAVTLGAGIILVLTFSGYGYTKHGVLDYACFFLALLAIAAWIITDNPLSALAISIFAAALAALPALIKTFYYPHSENLLSWTMNAIAAILAILSTTLHDFANLAAPFYQLLECSTFVALIYFGTRISKQMTMRV